MQGSFWKTVALVAVIGVGSLAILEVQNRLKNSPSVLEADGGSDDSSLAEELRGVTETSVDADLTESEFDKMLKAGFPPTDQQDVAANSSAPESGFDLSEPDAEVKQTFQPDTDHSAAQFSLADVGEQATAMASDWEVGEALGDKNSVQLASSAQIDTNVDAGLLTESPNPFAALTDRASNTDTAKIKPVGFVADEQPSFDTSTDGPFAAFDPTADNSAASNVTAAASAASDRQKQQALASRQVGQMEFYNGTNQDDSTEAAAKTVSADPVAFQQELATDVFDDAVSGGGFEQFETNNESLNTPSGASNPFPGFDFDSEPVATPSQPKRLPSTDMSGIPERSPFFPEQPETEAPRNDEPVPMPRNRFDNGPSFDSGGGSRGSFDDALTDADSLPFAEDAGSEVPVLNPVPERQRDDGLSIPRTNRDRDIEPGRRTFDGNGFDSQPSNLGRDLNPPQFNDFPETERGRSDQFEPRTRDGNIPEMDPINPDPFGRSNRSLEDSGSSIERRDQTFGDERLDRLDDREINPGFNSEPGRIPTIEDRRNDLRRSLNEDSRDNNTRDNSPLTIDPGFGSDFSDSERQRSDRQGSDRNFDLNDSRRPIREFGGSDRSQDLPDRASPRTPAFGGSSSGGSGPVRRDRDFEGSTYNQRQEDLRNVDERMGGNVRQVASVMRPKLTLQKTAPENATVGTPLQYSITIRNDGDAPAYDVVVEDEVTTTSRVDAAKPQASRSNDGERLVWEFASIGPGQEEEIQVQVTPTGEGVLDGVATVKFKSRVKATTMITAPRLELKMEGPAKVRLGDKVQYRYVITNEGSGEARSVFVRTVLPQNGGLRHPQGQDLEYEIPLMEPGEQREILLSVVAGEPGNQQAKALVSSRNGSKAEATWATDVVGAQLQMLRRGPKRRFVSKTARYENIVTNETDFDAVNARVVERIPPGMEFKAAGQNGRYDQTEKTVTWEIRRLGAKATTTLQLELEPRVAGQQDSRVTIFENIGAQSDDYVSTTVVEDLHNISATISQLDGPVAMGEVFGFTIAVDNRGTADATDIQLSVEVPAEIEVFGAGTKAVPAGLKRGTNTVVYQMVVRIKPDQQQDFELKLRGVRPGRNKIVKASVKYTQMSEPLEISESVTIYDDRN